MKNKTLFIGASGFVGTRLLDITNRDECYNLDKRNSTKYPELTIQKDIRDNDLVEKFPNDIRTLVLLAAEHRDDVFPSSLYYDVNVQGTINVLNAMDNLDIKNMIFTSTVAVYGLNKNNPDESHQPDPFNHYGKSKLQAERILKEWFEKDPIKRSLTIIRPTVIFGEGNRGNVFNLLKQIAEGTFFMVGRGKNYKSMAYVGNIAEFIRTINTLIKPGYQLFNYVDKPDLSMNELITQIGKSLGKKIPSTRIPYSIGLGGGYAFDYLSKCTGIKYSISSVRVKKFCATTQFNSKLIQSSVFKAPYSLKEGLDKTLRYEFG